VSANAKPLNVKCKMSQESDLCKMKCWPFGIVEGCPKDKDERVDDWSWEVVPGMAIRIMLWQEAARGGKADKFKSSMNSDDHTVIPAFTVFEIEMSCKGWSQWEIGDVNENAKNKPRYARTRRFAFVGFEPDVETYPCSFSISSGRSAQSRRDTEWESRL
jgi:hypothetical protein